jgi:hypothetical protein
MRTKNSLILIWLKAYFPELKSKYKTILKQKQQLLSKNPKKVVTEPEFPESEKLVAVF